jgi:hypothetical protein
MKAKTLLFEETIIWNIYCNLLLISDSSEFQGAALQYPPPFFGPDPSTA